jgi:hypothetical protein
LQPSSEKLVDMVSKEEVKFPVIPTINTRKISPKYRSQMSNKRLSERVKIVNKDHTSNMTIGASDVMTEKTSLHGGRKSPRINSDLRVDDHPTSLRDTKFTFQEERKTSHVRFLDQESNQSNSNLSRLD